MQTVVRKWGNSLALRLPQHFVADLRLDEGATVSLTIEDNALVVKPARKTYNLAELLKDHKPEHNHTEAVWGKPMGKEVW